jgi:outer membrane lipoprotein-sorting protein
MKRKLEKLIRNKILNIKIFLTFLFVVNNLFSIEYKELIEKLAEVDQKIEKIKSEYTQLINFVDLNEVYELKAKFIFVKPDKLKVEVYEPIKQIIVADSNRIEVKDVNNDIIYKFGSKKYFEKEYQYLPLLFSNIYSSSKKYTIVDFIKKTGLKFVAEEKDYYVLSTRMAKGKVYTDKKIGLRPGETRVILWIKKDTLYPEKLSLISEKYIIETEFKNYETNFDITFTEFELEKTTSTKIVNVE